MMQYEMAYDPNLAFIPYNQIQLKWYLNYCNVQEINLTGTQKGSIEGTIGGTIGSSGSSGVLSKFKTAKDVAGTGILAGIGMKFIKDHETDAKNRGKHTGIK